MFLAFVTYGFARSSVVQQRDVIARETARRNATDALEALRSNPPNAEPAIQNLLNRRVERPVIWYNGEWRSGHPSYPGDAIPQSLVDRVIDEGVAARQIAAVGDELNIIAGWPLPDERGLTNDAYFEFFSLDQVSDTLDSVRLSLVLGTAFTTALGVFAGSFAARRAVRPVGVAAQAAKAIAGGRLDTRLEPTEDPDLSCSPTRSTTWPPHSRRGSSATPGSRPT